MQVAYVFEQAYKYCRPYICLLQILWYIMDRKISENECVFPLVHSVVIHCSIACYGTVGSYLRLLAKNISSCKANYISKLLYAISPARKAVCQHAALDGCVKDGASLGNTLISHQAPSDAGEITGRRSRILEFDAFEAPVRKASCATKYVNTLNIKYIQIQQFQFTFFC